MEKFKPKVHPAIITALFRDGLFHNLQDKSGGEYYIDTLDDLLENDPETENFENLFDKNAKDPLEDYSKKISEIIAPYIKETYRNLDNLQKENWIKITSINHEVINVGFEEKKKYKDIIIPAGIVKTPAMKIKANWVNWEKFINYISDQGETMFQWINPEQLFSLEKQETTLGILFYQICNYLDKERNLILPICHRFGPETEDFKHIKILETLKRLEKKGFIIINGIAAYKTKMENKDVEYIALKADISLVKGFRKRVKLAIDQNRNQNDSKPIRFISFNANNGLINLTNKEVRLTQDKNPYYIMKTISQEPKKLWNYDELWEELYKTEYNPQNWNKIYQAAYAVNEAIAKKTTLQDFLLITKATVTINSKYLQ